MSETKYNWHQIKLDYMMSEFMSVSAFLRDRSITGGEKADKESGHISKKTRGWQTEKKELQKKMYESSLAEYQGEQKKKWKKAFRQLEAAELDQVGEFATLLSKGVIKRKDEDGKEVVVLDKFDHNAMRSTRYLIDILRYIRVTLGKPTEINQNYNQDGMAETTDLTAEDIQALRDLGLEDERIDNAEGILQDQEMREMHGLEDDEDFDDEED